MAIPTREVVAVSRIGDPIFSDQIFLNPGESTVIPFEIDLTTSDLHVDLTECSPPALEPIGNFQSSMGHLLDVFFVTTIPGFVAKFYQGIDFAGMPTWALVDQWIVSPGVVFKMPGYRLDATYGKFVLINTGSVVGVGELQLRLSSI